MFVDFWAGIGPFWQVIGIVAIVLLVFLLFLWPSSVVSMVLASVVVVASVMVTWNQVATYRTQKSNGTAPPQAGATVSPPGPTRAGS